MTSAKLASESWESLFRAQVALMRRFAADDIWQPITVREYDVLFTLSTSSADGLRLHDLNREILISQSSLSRMVERLEAKGLVMRHSVDDDGRGICIALTEAGRQMQKTIGRRHAQSIRKYLGPALSEDELQTLQRLCTKLRMAQAGIPD